MRLRLLLVFVALVVGISVSGAFYYIGIARDFRLGVERQLSSIADLKVRQLTVWRAERLGDGKSLFRNRAFTSLTRRLLARPSDADARRQLQSWLGNFAQIYDYDQVRLMDAQGGTRFSVPAQVGLPSAVTQRTATEVLQKGQIIFQDMYRNERDNSIYLEIFVPVLDEQRPRRPLGVVTLRINPSIFLFPFIQQWPVHSGSAETLILRRDGNDALFLNALRFHADAALSLRVPIDRHEVPAAMALSGREGILNGIDYRDVPVVSALRRIPESPWFLVAKVDVAEAFAPLKDRRWQVILALSICLFGAAATVALFWWQTQLRLTRERLGIEADRANLSAIVESSDDAIISKDTHGVIQSWNRGAERLYGYGAPEMIGSPFDILIPPELAAEESKLLAKIWRRDIVENYETERVAKDGRRIPVSLSLSPIYDSAGAIAGASSIARDITLRRQENAIQQARLRLLEFSASHGLDELLQQTLDEVCAITGSTVGFYHLVAANQQALVLHAWSTRTVKEFCTAEGKGSHYDLASAGVWADCIRQRTAVIYNDYAALSERRGLPPGHAPVERLLSVPIFRNDLIVAVLGVGNKATDYTAADQALVTFMADVAWELADRKLTEGLMHASETRYRRLFEAARDGILILDAETGMVVDVNPFMVELLGLSREAFLGRAVWELGFLKDIVANRDNFAELQLKEYVRYEDLALESHDGGRHEVEFVSNVYLVDGRKVIQCNIRDISERVRAQKEIHQLNVTLERRVAERTAALDASNTELEAFSYSVSHDLRAPLRSIDGFSRIVMDDYHDKLDADGRDHLTRIRAAAKQMGRLIDDLLKLARVSRAALHRERVDLSALARAVVAELRQSEPGRVVDVVVQGDLMARGDPTLLRVALDNLLGNAWKFTGKRDAAHIVFGAQQQDGETTYFVRDDGAGYDPTYADKLFGAFQRLHSTAEFSGTGIGLATVQRIIRRHGGRIWAEGQVNLGATFFFTLGV